MDEEVGEGREKGEKVGELKLYLNACNISLAIVPKFSSYIEIMRVPRID